MSFRKTRRIKLALICFSLLLSQRSHTNDCLCMFICFTAQEYQITPPPSPFTTTAQSSFIHDITAINFYKMINEISTTYISQVKEKHSSCFPKNMTASLSSLRRVLYNGHVYIDYNYYYADYDDNKCVFCMHYLTYLLRITHSFFLWIFF